jgi:hypothetical protein
MKKYLDIFNVISQIAGVSGITLLWLKDSFNEKITAPAIVSVLVSTAFLLGLASIFVEINQTIYERNLSNSRRFVRISILSCMIGISVFALYISFKLTAKYIYTSLLSFMNSF